MSESYESLPRWAINNRNRNQWQFSWFLSSCHSVCQNQNKMQYQIQLELINHLQVQLGLSWFRLRLAPAAPVHRALLWYSLGKLLTTLDAFSTKWPSCHPLDNSSSWPSPTWQLLTPSPHAVPIQVIPLAQAKREKLQIFRSFSWAAVAIQGNLCQSPQFPARGKKIAH